MMYKRKYTKGEKITSLDELVQQEFVYWHDKITHQGWVTSWQLRMACLAIQNGVIFNGKTVDALTVGVEKDITMNNVYKNNSVKIGVNKFKLHM